MGRGPYHRPGHGRHHGVRLGARFAALDRGRHGQRRLLVSPCRQEALCAERQGRVGRHCRRTERSDQTLSGSRRALILAGGGYVASSWEIGVVTGLADAGLDLRDADLFVGTSAGARVALDLTTGQSLEDIYRRRVEPGGPPPARPADAGPAIDWARIRAG